MGKLDLQPLDFEPDMNAKLDLQPLDLEPINEIPPEPPSASTFKDAPDWGRDYPNLYGLYGAGKEILRAGIEGGYTSLGAAGGAMIPVVPGTTLAGAGVGYATGKRVASSLLDEEPVDMSLGGITTDVATGAILQGGANLLSKVPYIKKVLSPSEADIGKLEGYSQWITDKAKNMYRRSLKPSTSPATTENVDRAIDSAMKYDIPITKGGVQTKDNIMESSVSKLNDIISTHPNRNHPIDLQDIIDATDDTRNFFIKTIARKDAIKEYDNVITQFIDEHPAGTITVAEAQELKRNTGALIKKYYGGLESPGKEARKQLVRGTKEGIEREIPEAAQINAQYGEMANLEPFLESAVSKAGNADLITFVPSIVAHLAGIFTGKVTSAVEAGAIAKILKSPAVNSRLALMLKDAGLPSRANLVADTILSETVNALSPKTLGESRRLLKYNF